ncbi:ADP-ribose pyrophosphatase YjhB (NUDIX family) [Peribacillus deserti]|uniref:ADP-ribose pyrophosphatase YjhB (NUDIX family) n=1 Tax=Peribacillus deserti TaxID=673318 RepID=A0ABS2QHX2_9BACI|nr:ADP-ribose pyrophosphatase YjhB (NUDIX family) [Peribacillus deserti]
MNIRNSVKAVIIDQGKVLLTKNQDREGIFYLFPGGGQEHGETFHETLVRECIEEIGQPVKIGELLFIREYIGKTHEHAKYDSEVHQVEYYFACELMELNRDQIGTAPDPGQIGTEWAALTNIMNYRVYPQAMRQNIIDVYSGRKSPIYLGNIN